MRAGEARLLLDVDAASTTLISDVENPEIAAIATSCGPDLSVFGRQLDESSVLVAHDNADRPVGFIAFERIEQDIYIWLLAVHPDHVRQKLGSRLLTSALDTGRSLGADRCVLSTFRDVPFNAPFYARHGFTELALSEAPSVHVQRFHDEVPPGTDPNLRLLMQFRL